MIISRTPFRISFFGGGTDYPGWYTEHGGAVLATSINKYCYIQCRYLPPFFDHRIRIVYSKIENCQLASEIAHPAVREILKYLAIDDGVEIHHDGDLPARSGMGSSSSFTVGLLNALHAMNGRMVSKHDLALQGIHIERDLLNETVGSQDQVLAAYGGFNRVLFQTNGEIIVTPMTLPTERIQALSSNIVLFYTGIIRTASDVASTFVPNILEKHRALHRIRQMVDEGCEILQSGGDLNGFGELLHEAWSVKKSLSGTISNGPIDDLYDAARDAGAIGGKVLGAGGGGFIMLFVPPAYQAQVRERLRKVIHVPVEFESAGSQIIFFDRQEDYSTEAAHRRMESKTPFRELSANKSATP